jgi:predicted  nucleic acid-binding Zn-ribbon protein
MNAAIQTLLKLQALEFGDETGKGVDSQIAQLRGQVPPAILGHYDRLRVRGKKGVAVVRNHVCTGCHMQQPIGKITVLMREEDIQLCDTCGRYLYLPEPAEGEFVERMAAVVPAEITPEKPAPKPRKRRAAKPLAAAMAL